MFLVGMTEKEKNQKIEKNTNSKFCDTCCIDNKNNNIINSNNISNGNLYNKCHKNKLWTYIFTNFIAMFKLSSGEIQSALVLYKAKQKASVVSGE